MSATFSIPDRSNIQGLILRGYTHPCSCHLLFTFTVATGTAATRSFFNDLYDKLQSAADWGANKPASMLNIGLTFNGIQQLNIIDPGDLANFPPSFKNGPWSAGSQASLADICHQPNSAEGIPSNWWNGNGDYVNENLHCVVHAYGLTSNDLDTLVDYITASAAKNGITEILPLAKTNESGRLYQVIVDKDPDKIHFGYTDGISEPGLKAPGTTGDPSPGDYNNFLIGYYNGSASQPGPFDTTSAGLFAKDGCYNAFRIIYQDVAAFNNFLKQQAAAWAEKLSFLKLTETELEEWFAAKLCGRWRNGSPLMLNPDKPGEHSHTSQTGEDFGYTELDSPSKVGSGAADVLSGLSCPFSAHTRVNNPRNQNLRVSESIDGPPRILRRGMPYGAELKSVADDGVDRGLIGMFLCGSLAGQFEKLYGWMNNNNFSDKHVFNVKHPPQDALLANRSVTIAPYKNNYSGVVTNFTIPIQGGDILQEDKIIIPATLPQFVITRGTAYCLLPSMESLAKIAGRGK